MRPLTTLLSNGHNKENFFCGEDKLDIYLKNYARQDFKKKISVCYVYPETGNEIQGYYTLSNGSVPRNYLPESMVDKLPKYKNLPVTILGRLAVDKRYQGRKLGKQLLIDALQRCLLASEIIGSIAVIVDPIDEAASHFYKKYGFISLPDSKKMVIMLKTFEKDLS